MRPFLSSAAPRPQMRTPEYLFSTETCCTTTPDGEHRRNIQNMGDASSLRRYWGLRVLRLCDQE